MSVPAIADTPDLRAGPEINEALLALLPLVGLWAGHGTGLTPGERTEFQYAQRASFVHDGRPFLSYTSHSWLLNSEGTVLRPAFRESGFLRVGPSPDDVELVLATAAGIVEVFSGRAGDQRWELATSAVGRTSTAKETFGERRLYALVDDALVYAQELGVQPGDFQPHLQARLTRGQ
jgi:hypothetical protein